MNLKNYLPLRHRKYFNRINRVLGGFRLLVGSVAL